MCGRFYRFSTVEDVAVIFGAKVNADMLIPPTFNAPPQTRQLVIRLDENGEREVVPMRWGFIAEDTKDPKKAAAPINARAETILGKWPFKHAILKRRCLVPVNGFYEWQDPGEGAKQPYAIGMKDGSPYALAGIWEAWVEPLQLIRKRIVEAEERALRLAAEQGAGNEPLSTLFAMEPEKPVEADPDLDPTPRVLLTFAVITCAANSLVGRIHDRMPVIVHPDNYDYWLAPSAPEDAPLDLLRPFPAELMQVWKVRPDVGNTRNNRPDLIEPI